MTNLSKLKESVQMYSPQPNPMMLPPVLDILLPYLNFRDLKSSRLVCSKWDAIALPIIGRKELKPDFSQITFEDFLVLKLEFEEDRISHSKLKLFKHILRKFRLTWEQISAMANCQFMASFQPSKLFISGNDVADPSASLILLISPIVATLTHLHLEIKWDGMPSFNLDCLIGLGIRLKGLHLDIHQDNAFQGGSTPLLDCGMFHLLESQASNLEELFIRVVCNFGKTFKDVNKAVQIINQIPRFFFPKITSLGSSRNLDATTPNCCLTYYTSG